MSCSFGRLELPALDLLVATLKRGAARGLRLDEILPAAIREYAAARGIRDVPADRLLGLLAQRQNRNVHDVLHEAMWEFTFSSAS